MKKVLFFAAFIFMALGSMNAQGQFRAGVSGGLPIRNAGDLATFAVAVDLGYLFEISDFFDAGVATGYSHSFVGDSTLDIAPTPIVIEGQDVQFIPVAVAGRFRVTANFVFGADLGYAIGISDGNHGGFYYSPRVQYGVSEAIDIVVAFRGLYLQECLGCQSWDIVTAGIEFGID